MKQKAKVAGRIACAFHLSEESESEMQLDEDDDWDNDCLLLDTESTRPACHTATSVTGCGARLRVLRMVMQTGEQPAAPGMNT